jgi:hypothetical protein
MNYLEPWQLEGAEAIEIIVGFPPMPVAWTVDDDVFVRTESTAEREDGYILIGQLEWVDTPDDPADDAGYNIERLREFVLAWRKEQK